MLIIVGIIVGIIFAIIGAFFIAMNWVYFAMSQYSSRHVSLMPPIGGVLAAIGLGWIPGIAPWAALAIVADPGTWFLAMAAAVKLWQVCRGRGTH